MSILQGIFYLKQQVCNVMAGCLHVPTDLVTADGGQFCLGMTGELEPVKLGADVEVSPQGSHVFSPPFSFVCKKGIFCHSVMSVKDEGI